VTNGFRGLESKYAKRELHSWSCVV